MSADPRLALAVAALRAAGIQGARVEAAGAEGEIAALRLAPGAWTRLLDAEGAALADEVKAAGFRYVTLDLAGDEAGAPDGA